MTQKGNTKTKEYYQAHKQEAKKDYFHNKSCYGGYDEYDSPWDGKLSISNVITSYISETLFLYLHNDGVRINVYESDIFNEIVGYQRFNEKDLEVIKETIRFLIQFITEEDKQKLRNVVNDYYNKNKVILKLGDEVDNKEDNYNCWTNFIDLDELGIGR